MSRRCFFSKALDAVAVVGPAFLVAAVFAGSMGVIVTAGLIETVLVEVEVEVAAEAEEEEAEAAADDDGVVFASGSCSVGSESESESDSEGGRSKSM